MAKKANKPKEKAKKSSKKPTSKKTSTKKTKSDAVVEKDLTEKVISEITPEVVAPVSPNQHWKDYAITHNITHPFFQVSGTVYRTSDGKGYGTPAEFFADGGERNWSNVKVIS